MKEKLLKYLQDPSPENFSEVRLSLITHPEYSPYSRDIDHIAQLQNQNKHNEALAAYFNSMPNMALSPKVHLLAALSYTEIKSEEEAKTKLNMYYLCIEGILSTGEGTEIKPYLVCRVSDEYDILDFLKKERIKQSLLSSANGKKIDRLDLSDGASIYFDISEPFAKISV